MAIAAETRIAEPTGRLRLVPARLAQDDSGTALALSAQISVQFALAAHAETAHAETAHAAPTSDMTDPTLVDLVDVVGALPGVRLFGMDEVGRADVVVFTDASLPALALAPSYPSAAVVVLTEHAAIALTYLRAHHRARHEVGWAVLPPTSAPLALAAAITAAAQGLTVLTASHTDLLLSPELAPERHGVNGASSLYDAHDGPDVATSSLHTTPPTPTLTTRERETLELLSEGLSNKLIARRLRISEHTVKFHISALYAKLGASSRADAVGRAVRGGVLTLTG